MIDERAMPTEHLKRMKVLVVDPTPTCGASLPIRCVA